MDATCTEARERATATAGSAAEESWSLLVKTERSKPPCPSHAGRTGFGRTDAARALAGAQGRSNSVISKVGNIVSAEREDRLGSAASGNPKCVTTRSRNNPSNLWGIIMPENTAHRDSKCLWGDGFREIACRGASLQLAVRQEDELWGELALTGRENARSTLQTNPPASPRSHSRDQ